MMTADREEEEEKNEALVYFDEPVANVTFLSKRAVWPCQGKAEKRERSDWLCQPCVCCIWRGRGSSIHTGGRKSGVIGPHFDRPTARRRSDEDHRTQRMRRPVRDSRFAAVSPRIVVCPLRQGSFPDILGALREATPSSLVQSFELVKTIPSAANEFRVRS
ncbi:unnamed protein product [Caenorhabditis auriculariae]|uniref:Uncharacterized protein n=1 Tax=Caenorhabditis auriculariae TaxID=2777116 RepID=A0A8S1HPS7_9PELO|nr:unnamed protein product [Caenorhabditis auriculariae]